MSSNYCQKLESLLETQVPNLHYFLSIPSSQSSIMAQNLETFYMSLVSLLEYHFKSMFSHSENDKKKHILFVCLGGSHLYQTWLTDTLCNDFDFWTVFQKDLSQQFSLPAIQNVQQSVLTYNYSSLDYTCYEVDKFCDMLLAANPFALEILFSFPFENQQIENKIVVTEELQFTTWIWTTDWVSLLSMRRQFVTKKVVSKYLGYAKSQLVTAIKEKDASNSHHVKSVYHAIRCALECLYILEQGSLCIQWKQKQPEKYALLLQIRKQEIKMEACKSKFQELTHQIEEQLKTSTLKDDVTEQEKQQLNSWLVQYRIKTLLQ